MPSQSDLTQAQKALARIAAAAAWEWAEVWRSLPRTDRVVFTQAVSESWVGVIEHYGDMAAVLAGDLFEVQAAVLGIRPQVALAAGVDVARATARVAWAISTPDQFGNTAVLLDELVKQPYRSTFQDSAWKSRAGWARVPSGNEPCNFCLMLASRGGVYRSEQLALLGVNGKKYHGDCNCQPVLVRGPQDYPAGYDPDALYGHYLAGKDQHPH